jgi:hypothetical protein
MTSPFRPVAGIISAWHLLHNSGLSTGITICAGEALSRLRRGSPTPKKPGKTMRIYVI